MNSSSTERKSNIAEELANGGFYCLGNPQQSLNGDDFFSALNFPQVLGVQVSPFRQFLLGKPGFLAIKTYGLSDKLSVPQNRLSLSLGFGHCRRSVSVQGLRITPATCWYFSACLFFTTPVKDCMLEGKAVALIRGMRERRKESPSPEACRWLRPCCGRKDFSALSGRGARPIRQERMPSAGMRLFGTRQELRHVNSEGFRQNDQFSVSDAAQLRFDFRQSGPTQFQTAAAPIRGRASCRVTISLRYRNTINMDSKREHRRARTRTNEGT